MTDVSKLLDEARTVLLIDWPDRDVPDSLARSGYSVVSHDGPGPDEFNAYEIEGDGIRVRHVGRPPQQADLVYSHRPIDELPEIVETARSVGAKAVWIQSGRDDAGGKDPRGCWLPEEESARARSIVEAAGLDYVDAPYIADAVRSRDLSGVSAGLPPGGDA